MYFVHPLVDFSFETIDTVTWACKTFYANYHHLLRIARIPAIVPAYDNPNY